MTSHDKRSKSGHRTKREHTYFREISAACDVALLRRGLPTWQDYARKGKRK